MIVFPLSIDISVNVQSQVGTLSHLMYGVVPSRLEILSQKYCQVSAGRPKDIGKGFLKLAQDFAIISENCLH